MSVVRDELADRPAASQRAGPLVRTAKEQTDAEVAMVAGLHDALGRFPDDECGAIGLQTFSA